MVTHKEAAGPVDPQRCSAVGAVSHDGIIGEAGATDRQETSSAAADVWPLMRWIAHGHAYSNGPSAMY